jgi:hypothetical protein
MERDVASAPSVPIRIPRVSGNPDEAEGDTDDDGD